MQTQTHNESHPPPSFKNALMIHVGKLRVNRKELGVGKSGVSPLAIVENIQDISKKATSREIQDTVIHLQMT